MSKPYKISIIYIYIRKLANNNTNINYDTYYSTKKALKQFRSSEEEKLKTTWRLN